MQCKQTVESVVDNDPLAFLIDTDDFGVDDPSHFNTSGYIDLGKALAESYFTNVAVPEQSASGTAIVLLLACGALRYRCTHRTG